MNITRISRTFAASILALLSAAAMAVPPEKAPPAFRLAKIFGDNMVLQQDKPVRIWGWAPAGAKVAVTLTQDRQAGEKAVAETTRIAEASPVRPAKASQPAPPDPNGRSVTVVYVEKNPPAPINETLEATAGADGKWLAEFKPAKASFQPTWVIARQGQEILTVRNVLIGELWVCAGQSNMVMKEFERMDRETESADFPALRYVEWDDSWYRPLDDVKKAVAWQACSPETAANFSAVPYLYGMFLQRYLKVPVGIINVSRGGTDGKTWCMREELDNIDNDIIKAVLKKFDSEADGWEDPDQVAKIMDRWQKACDAARAKHELDLAKHKQELAKFQAEAKPKPGVKPPVEPKLRLPAKPSAGVRSGWSPPAGLFNATVMPIRQLRIRGVLYYQGETQAYQLWTRYEYTFPKIPVSFRKAFGDADLWFGCIDMPGWGTYGEDPEVAAADGGYQVVRDIQHRALKGDAHAGMIAAYWTGNSSIHPKEKLPVAEYASLWALANVYGKPVVHRAPQYQKMVVRDDKVYLFFDTDPVLLERLQSQIARVNAVRAKNKDPKVDKLRPDALLPCPREGNAEYKGFTIAGGDQRWYPASARHAMLDGNACIELSSDLVKQPVAARYCWERWPTGNLVGQGNLPVHAFRTDDWPLPVAELEIYPQEVQLQIRARLAEALAAGQKQALDRKLRQAMIDVPKLEASIYIKGADGVDRLVAAKIARLESILDELKGQSWHLRNLLKDHPGLAAKIDAVRKAAEALKPAP